jgi:hypothetical protein
MILPSAADSSLDRVTTQDCYKRPSSTPTLRRSILERAFTGRLVPQDPSDEPAAALLERIAAERAAAASATGRRPRRRATMKRS